LVPDWRNARWLKYVIIALAGAAAGFLRPWSSSGYTLGQAILRTAITVAALCVIPVVEIIWPSPGRDRFPWKRFLFPLAVFIPVMIAFDLSLIRLPVLERLGVRLVESRFGELLPLLVLLLFAAVALVRSRRARKP
jgi:hypothetical protein